MFLRKIQKNETFCALAFCLMLFGRVEADDATIQRFKDEAPRAWREVANFYDGKSFKFEKRNSEPKREFVCHQRKIDIRIDTSIIHDGKRMSGVELANQYYAASAGDAYGDGNMILMGAEPRQPSDPWKLSNSIVDFAGVRPSLSVINRYLPESFVGFPDFPKRMDLGYVVRSAVSQVGKDGHEVVRLKIESCQKNDRGNFETIENTNGYSNFAELTLSPSRNWCVVSYRGPVRVNVQDKTIEGTESVFVEYGSSGFHPTFKRAITEIAGNKKEIEFEFSLCTDAEKPADFFRVTSLGLPELDQYIPSSRRYWYMALIGICAALVGIALRMRNKNS